MSHKYLFNVVFSVVFLLGFFLPQANAQVISYLTPDIGAAGMNVYVEIIGPEDITGNFGADGFYPNNSVDGIRLECVNLTDTSKIKIGPLVVSWNGRLISSQIFVHPDVQPNSYDWQALNPEFRIPLQLVINGFISNTEIFYLVRPQPAIVSSSNSILGSGGQTGIRSKRGAMIFDSLILLGDSYRISRADCDPTTPGNQGYLPANIHSLGAFRTSWGTVIDVDAIDKHAGPGGGGGGGNFCDFTGSGSDGGDGFTGGGPGGRNRSGNPIGSDEYRNPGIGTGVNIGNTGGSINGIPGGTSPAYESSGGGTGHPFGISGEGCADGGNCNPPGKYGGGSGQIQAYDGGAGGYATRGESSRNGNGGQIHGNGAIVPLAGGSGGASGNPQLAFNCSGDGGGGGGALAISAAFCDAHLLTSNGGGGKEGGSGDGGSGSGGAVILQSKLPSSVWKIMSIGGVARGPRGGAGRIRMDGPLGWNSSGLPVDESLFYGPSTDTSRYVPKTFTLTGTGNGERIALYMKSERMPWTEIETLTGYGQQWSATITLPTGEGLYFLAAVQEVPNPSSDRYTAEPVEVFSQSAANIFIYKAVPVIASDRSRKLPTLLCENEERDTLYVRNEGDADLLLESASFRNAAAGFTLESPSTFPVTIAGGDSTAFITHFVPPSRPGLFLDTLIISSNDLSTTPNPWSIQFEAAAELVSYTVSADSVVFQDLILCERSFTDTVITLTNNGSVPITIEAPIISGSAFTLEDPLPTDFPLTIPAGGILDIRLRFSSASTASYFGAADFKADSLGCGVTQTVWLHGESFDAAIVSDSSVVFPALLCSGTMTDTTVVLANTGDYAVTVTTAAFSGVGFSLLSPIPPFIVPGGISIPVRIRFAPAASGTYQSVLRFEGSPCDLWTETEFVGTKDSLGLLTTSVDFGLVAPGDFPVTQTGLLRNSGTVPITIFMPVPSGSFEIVAGLPATLQPGETVVVTVQFSDPGTDGNYAGQIDLPHEPDCMPVYLPVTGSRGTASLILAIDTAAANAGDFLDIAVYLRNLQNVRLFGATAISTELRLNKSLLVPQFSPSGSVQGNDRIIPLLITLETDENDIALLLRFQATLGNAESSPLTFENTKPVNGDLDIVEEHGYFSLLDICREGGNRLFDDGGSVDLAPNNPNPFNPVTEISYEIIERGQTTLVVMDRLGRRVALLVDEYLQPGRYSALFDGNALPSGTYIYILQTPTQTRMRKMLLLK